VDDSQYRAGDGDQHDYRDGAGGNESDIAGGDGDEAGGGRANCTGYTDGAERRHGDGYDASQFDDRHAWLHVGFDDGGDDCVQRDGQRQRGRDVGDVVDQYGAGGDGERDDELVRDDPAAGGFQRGDNQGFRRGGKFQLEECGGDTELTATIRMFGAWLSLVERLVRDQEAGGSNPLAPTIPSRFQKHLADLRDLD
jgi:hypothetical protein